MTTQLVLAEADWQRQVIDLAQTFRWAHYHPWLSIHSPRGWPDLALCRPPRLVLAELKSERGKLTEAQARWLRLLGQCDGVEVYLWRPHDLDHVMATLR